MSDMLNYKILYLAVYHNIYIMESYIFGGFENQLKDTTCRNLGG